jgi:hypothetical protein
VPTIQPSPSVFASWPPASAPLLVEEIVGASGGDLRLVCAWPYGEVYVLDALWRRLASTRSCRAARRAAWADGARTAWWPTVPVRCKLYCWEQGWRGGAHPGTQGVSLQHLYRAMDFLEANKGPSRSDLSTAGHLLNLDVEVLFDDTRRFYFEIDQPTARRRRRHRARQLGRRARRTGAGKHGLSERPQDARRSSWAWRSRARASRCAIGVPATP